MISLKKIYILIFTIFFYCSHLVALESNVFFIDVDYLLKNSKLGKNILKNLDELNNKNINFLKKDEEELKKIDNEINNTKNVISKDELEKKVINFRSELKTYEEKKDKLSKEFTKRRVDQLNDFLNKISPIIQDFMKDNSISILVEKKNIFIGSSEYDITEDIILLMNQKFE